MMSSSRDRPHLSSLLGPTHTRPPCRGDGLLQERWRSSKPVPQVVLHCPHDDQGVQPPFLWQQTHGKVLANPYFTITHQSELLVLFSDRMVSDAGTGGRRETDRQRLLAPSHHHADSELQETEKQTHTQRAPLGPGNIHSICLSALFLGSTSHDLIATFCKSTIQFGHRGLNLAERSGGMKVAELFVCVLLSERLIGQFPPQTEEAMKGVTRRTGTSPTASNKIPHVHDLPLVLSECKLVSQSRTLQSQSGRQMLEVS